MMSKKLAHGLEIKKAAFNVDVQLNSLQKFKGTVFKSSELKDFSVLKNQHIAFIGFSSTTLVALNKALPYASFIKLFCENPTWVLQPHQSVFSVLAPLQSEKVNRLRQDSEKQGYFILSAQDKTAQYPIKVAQRNLKQIKNEWLARQLTPHHLHSEHTFIFSHSFYEDVQNPRVKVITWPIVQVLDDGILTMEGINHLVDIIIIP